MIDASRLQAVALAHATPVYAYDLDAIGARVRELRAALPSRVDLAFAVKANPSPAVLRAMAGSGIGADVASAGELAAVLEAGFDASTVIFTGPGKRDDELARAAAASLRGVTVESLGELRRLVAEAREAGTRVPVLLRAAADDASAGNVIGASPGRFGMQPAEVAAAAQLAASAPEVDLIGLHRFGASNVLDAHRLLAAAAETVALARDLAAAVGQPLKVIDLGGGLGISYAGEAPLDVGILADGLERLVRHLDQNTNLAGARLLIEPGRYLVGPFGSYVTRVIDTKEGPEGLVVTVDGGIHHLLRPALIGQPHRVRLLGSSGDESRRCTIGGPLCTGLDVLARVDLPEPRVGDLLAIDDVGAYGFTQSMPLFLSHPWPAEVVLSGSEVRLARRRIDPAEVDALGRPGLTAIVLET